MSKKSDPNGWAKDVNDLYDVLDKPVYVPKMETAQRAMYPTKEMEDNELLTTLSKVRLRFTSLEI